MLENNIVLSVLTTKCPRCRKGDMFLTKSPFTKSFLKMYEHCPVCGQQYELETGFWWGTGYVSYGLSVGASVISFLLWCLIIGMSVQDSRPFYWLGFNAVLLLVLTPYLMRLSRALWLVFFISYDANAVKNKTA